MDERGEDEVEVEERQREKGDDDGVEYSDPRDEIEERRQAAEAIGRRFDELFDWFIEGPK